MRIVKAENKKRVVMTRKEWEAIGKKAQWNGKRTSGMTKSVVWKGKKHVSSRNYDTDPSATDYLEELTSEIKSYFDFSDYVGPFEVGFESVVTPVTESIAVKKNDGPDGPSWDVEGDFEIEIRLLTQSPESIGETVDGKIRHISH